ncbi:MAG: class II fructose-bisphosphatase [Candidatus Liptonbacteria bacterium]|nr:class II fructose-bisphosphatase [Candidatus Liptonbacteria bacterium]
MQREQSLFEHLALDFVRVTELAAIAAARWIGKGDAHAADGAAVDAMRAAMSRIQCAGKIVIGEGAKDEAPELFVGEKVGNGKGVALDIAVDPLECTSSVAFGRTNALTVIAAAPKGMLYHAADSYMQKLAVPPAAKNKVDLDAPAKDTIRAVAHALGKDVPEITVAILDRDRHKQLIKDVRAADARVQLFTDGDVAMAIATCLAESPVDILMGTGGSAEAVLSASAMKTLGGGFFCRWRPKDEKHIARLRAAGVTKFDTLFSAETLAKGDEVTFTATGVLAGPLAEGVVFAADHVTTHSVVMSSREKLVRRIETRHAYPAYRTGRRQAGHMA